MNSDWVVIYIIIVVVLILPSVAILAFRDKYILKRKIFPSIPHISIHLQGIKDDIQYCLNRAQYTANHASQKNTAIFFLLLHFILGLAIFYSVDKVTFYLNIGKIFFISSSTFFVYCIADSLWFSFSQYNTYISGITFKENIDFQLKRHIPHHNEINPAYAEEILYTVTYNYMYHYKNRMKRYVIEILVLLLVLLFTFPWFALFNFALICGSLFYVIKFEKEAIIEAYCDLGVVISCIYTLHRANPRKCKRFITQNKFQEIKDVTMLYESIKKRNPYDKSF